MRIRRGKDSFLVSKEAGEQVYNATMRNFRIFFTYKLTPATLTDKYIVVYYRALVESLHKMSKQKKCGNFVVDDYLTTEGWIAYKLSENLIDSESKIETKKVTNTMKTECEEIKRKMKEIKNNEAVFETEDDYRSRLANYVEKEFLDDMIESRKELIESYESVEKANKVFTKALNECYKASNNK